jgi:hypothetical protein
MEGSIKANTMIPLVTIAIACILSRNMLALGVVCAGMGLNVKSDMK